MDEETSVALVKQAWTCVGRHDLSALLDLLAPDIIWEIPNMPAVPFAGIWRGREGVLKFFQTVDAAQEIIQFAPESFIADGRTVVVLGNFANRVKSTGKTARSAWAQIWTAETGKLTSMREYVDTLAVNSAYLPDNPPSSHGSSAR
jgi:ketosteroid isomerase-like protein